MNVRLWHSISVALMLLFGPMQYGCSSSSQQQGSDENLESSEEGNQQEAGNEEGNEQGNAANEDEGSDENNVNVEEGEGEASDEVVDEDQLSNDEGMMQADQQGDLQEIIEEMNQGDGNVMADGGNMTESVMAENNASDMSEPAGIANQMAVEDISGSPMDSMPANAAPMNATGSSMAAPMSDAPMAAPAAPGLPEMGSKMSYVVQKGDTLAKIAQKVYGNASKWTEIASFTGIANPKLIYPGDVVYYQLSESTQAFASAYESMPRAEVQVQTGDTLSTIAGRVLGDSTLWKLIWRQNDNIDNPDKLVAGTTVFYIQPGAVSAAIDSVKDSLAKVVTIVENFDSGHTSKGLDLDNFESDFYYQQSDNHSFNSLI